jgi:DNA-directed RNA polymerase subunit delta
MAEKRSYVDVAYDVMTKAYSDNGNKSVAMKFPELLVQVGNEMGITGDKELLAIASRFYTALTMDGRFVIKENNTWVLREHEKYENVHIDMNDVYDEEDEGEKGETEEPEKEEDEEAAGKDEDDDAESEKGEDGDEEEN